MKSSDTLGLAIFSKAIFCSSSSREVSSCSNRSFVDFVRIPLLDSVQQILNGGVRLTELLFKGWQAEAVAPLQFHDQCCDCFDRIRIIQKAFDFSNNQLLQPLLFHGGLLAAFLLPLDRGAFVIVMHAVSTGADLTDHWLTTISAKELAREYVFILCLISGGGLFVFLHSGLYPVKQVLRYDLGDAIRHKNKEYLYLLTTKAILKCYQKCS